jgi:C_GCAxxG_C_C family probable redox protein
MGEDTVRTGQETGTMGDRSMAQQPTGQDAEEAAVGLARDLYLDEAHPYGCAETCFMVLKTIYGLDHPLDPSAAIGLNGGVGWSGAMCGALTGAALALGLLAERRIPDHPRAKLVARELVADALERFRVVHGSVDCRELIGCDLRTPGEHDAFLASGIWRTRCMGQIETTVAHLAGLAAPATWDQAVEGIEARAEH